MARYKGNVIHSSRDNEGLIDVVEDQTTRSLYFDSGAKQSGMYLHDPVQLALSYTRAMMGFLLFNSEPKRVLLLGMGGGSLAKFILHHFPDCIVDAVERRPNVVKLAQGYFQLPQTPNLNIFIDDAYEYMGKNRYTYDTILIDAYDAHGMSESVNHLRFFDNCQMYLEKNGVVSMNLWNHNKDELKDTLNMIKHSFGDNVQLLPVPEKGNLVILVLKQKLPSRELKQMNTHAISLGQKYNLELPALLGRLRKHNTRWYERALGIA